MPGLEFFGSGRLKTLEGSPLGDPSSSHSYVFGVVGAMSARPRRLLHTYVVTHQGDAHMSALATDG